MIDLVEWLRSHKIQRYHEAAEMIEQLREQSFVLERTDKSTNHSISYDYSAWPYEADQ